MKYIWYYETQIGSLGIGETNEAISAVLFDSKKLSEYKEEETTIIKRAILELMEYFDGQRIRFDLPLFSQGTEFQKLVWNELQTIPFGQTRSYKDIAQKIGFPKAARAVGMANNLNPLPIIVPCHRVISGNGSLSGYSGGLAVKQYLLNLEKNHA